MQLLTTNDLHEIYGEGTLLPPSVIQRYENLITKFQLEYGHPPSFIVRAPGRVNLIGEHIDYEGYSVLPMAISKEVLMAVSLSYNIESDIPPKIHLSNTQSHKYPKRVLEVNPLLPIEDGHDWSHYFLCGYKGVWLLSNKILGKEDKNKNDTCKDDSSEAISCGLPMDILIDGDIPAGSGLSSSSALVVASAITTRVAVDEFLKQCINRSKYDTSRYWNNASQPLTAEQIGELCCEAEHFIGTLSGGMDQAISCLGKAGYARLIHFSPLRTEEVRLPSGFVFVIANSMTVSEKAQTASTHYNYRVVECMLASKLLAKCLSLDDWVEMKTLKEVQEHYERNRKLDQKKRKIDHEINILPHMGELVQKYIHVESYTHSELCETFNISNLSDCFKNCPSTISDVLASAKEFKLNQRAQHVYSEASRVFMFQSLCNQSSTDSNDIAIQLGKLMNDSHQSCANYYECSSNELEELTELSRNIGALGSRLTGAGWGGCTVSLVPENLCEHFIQELQKSFYEKRGLESDGQVFSCRPSNGASILFSKEQNKTWEWLNSREN